ncbi:unnamed protein product [Cylicocyclus nassatus]|uniref:Uncharacterized protein n=1 Tax=Cylicocyclus nassatus TaxID=53992 RepID=A0AA36GST4_CYLNA|nr:unnamed protein product [Cylicocyclus nassatus]
MDYNSRLRPQCTPVRLLLAIIPTHVAQCQPCQIRCVIQLIISATSSSMCQQKATPTKSGRRTHSCKHFRRIPITLILRHFTFRHRR